LMGGGKDEVEIRLRRLIDRKELRTTRRKHSDSSLRSE
jgi:hypothetical protein